MYKIHGDKSAKYVQDPYTEKYKQKLEQHLTGRDTPYPWQEDETLLQCQRVPPLGPSGNKTQRVGAPRGRHVLSKCDTNNSEGEEIANKGKHGSQRKPPTCPRVREGPVLAS